MRHLGVWVIVMCISTGLLHAQNYYWDGSQNSQISNKNNWVGGNQPTFSSSSEVWNFALPVTNNVNVNQPNVDLAGFHFRPGSGSYTISNSQVYEVFGFNVGGETYAIYNDTANTQTLSGSTVKFYGTDLNFHTGTGKLVFNASSEFSQAQRMHFVGQGSTEFNATINVNSVRYQFSNSGTNTVNVNLNSAVELLVDGGGVSTFNGTVSVSNGLTSVSNGSTAIFNSTVNTQKLEVTSGAKIYLNNGNTSVNQGIDIKCGTLLLSRSNVTDNTINAMGGIFNMQGFSESNLQSLTLSKNSTFDFGSTSGSNRLHFNGAGTFTSGTMLTVMNWQQGMDTFEVLNIGNSKAQQIRFYGDYGSGLGFYQATLNGNTLTPGNFLYANAPDPLNCVPAPVPEPSTYLMGGALMIALGYFELRRRRRLRSPSPLPAHSR